MQTELCRNNQADKADEYPKYPFQRRYESILLVRRIREIRVLYKHRVSLLHIDGVPLNCQPFIMDFHPFSVTPAIAVCNNALLNCITSLVLLDSDGCYFPKRVANSDHHFLSNCVPCH